MFWHSRVFKEGLTVVRGATTKFDLPANVNLGSIFLKMESRQTAGNPMAALAKWRLIDYIDSIIIMANGSTPIKALPATVLSALCMYDQGGFPPDQESEYSQQYPRVNSLINFGRYFRDPEMYIPAGKYDSLELQVKFSGSATEFQEDIGMDVIFEQPEGVGVPPSKGFLRTEVWREWTTVMDKTTYLTLPSKYDIRRIILQAWPDLDANENEERKIFDQMYNIDLTQKNGTVEMYKNGLEYLAKMECIQFGGPFKRTGQIYHTANKGFYTGLGYVISCQYGSGSKADAVCAAIPTLQSDVQLGTQSVRSMTADEPQPFQATGICPDNCVRIGFDDDPDPASWLNPRQDGDIDLNIHVRNTANAADGTNKVILDRLVPA